MEILIISIIVLVILVVVYFKKKRSDSIGLSVEMPFVFPYNYTSTKGVVIRSVESIPDEKQMAVFTAIDTGIDNLLKATADKFWYNADAHNKFTISFIPKQATNMDGSPALMTVNGIQTAGTVVGLNDGYSPLTMVLPVNWDYTDYLMYSVWHEGEHFREWLNDRNIFHYYLGANDIHPHFPLASLRALYIPEVKKFSCGVGKK